MGRGSSGAGGGKTSGGGLNPNNIKSKRDLVSERERKQAEVDSVLSVARDIHDQYGVDVGQFVIADIVGKDSNTLAYYDGESIGFNSKYFDSKNMQAAYDDCVKSGFHPPRGNKSGLEAVAAHEFGHALNLKVTEKLGAKVHYSMEKAADEVVKRAMKQAGVKESASEFKAKVSGYARTNSKEAIAEAVADVYCNGRKAKPESRAIVDAMNSIIR